MWALIVDGAAWELTDADPTGRFHEGLVWVSAPAGTQVGDLWNGTAFSRPVAPPAPVPTSVSKAQAVLALQAQPGTESGKTLLDDVEAAVGAASDPRVALVWNNTYAIDRNGLFVEQVAKAAPLSMTEDQLDALFTAAAEISV